MTADPSDREVLKEPVSNFDGFHSVLYSKLGETGVLYAGEMDCFDPQLDPKTSSPPATYVELKTSRLLSTNNQRRNFWYYSTIEPTSDKFKNIEFRYMCDLSKLPSLQQSEALEILGTELYCCSANNSYWIS